MKIKNGESMDEIVENLMFIKKVITYDGYYAEYIVTDGKYDLICMDTSIPLPPGVKEPEQGMRIAKIFAFSIDDTNIKRIEDDKSKKCLVKKRKRPLSYYLQAEIIDKESALVRIGRLIIETEELSDDLKNGDFIGFEADRLDCLLYE